ncbi:uncharacterized protein VP01_657g6 [Puccinia sorghi]|uniref:Uncharacterized protein n=1 Tax=Puccinia sorghi TaxID=27349 RepID=A0A0L6UF86_9BASI|nr:uncharacterized protein VP01_657g6 [Puccinia sorghi]
MPDVTCHLVIIDWSWWDISKWSKSGNLQPQVSLFTDAFEGIFATPQRQCHALDEQHFSFRTCHTYDTDQSKISFKQDAWMAPNCVGFMVVPAHFINQDLVMRDLTLAVPQFQGNLKLSFSNINTFH